MLKKNYIFKGISIALFAIGVYASINYIGHICISKVVIRYEETINYNGFVMPIPTDHEKKFVYAKSFQNKLRYKKGVFLTFDDGPSKNTLKILDILNESNLKENGYVFRTFKNLTEAEERELTRRGIINR